MKLSFALFVVGSLFVSANASTTYIGSSGGKDYYVSSFGTQFSQAAQSCRNSGMVIATPQSQTEFNDLVRYFDTVGFTHAKDSRAFVGISKNGHQWAQSETGTAIAFSVTWFPAQPSGDGTCSEILKELGHLGLNDLSCGHTRHFICEKSVHIPQSTTSAPVRKAPVTDSPITVTNAPVTEDSVNSVNSQCENEKAALNARIGLLSSVLQSKMAEIKELLSQNEKKTAELNENREKIQRLEMINHIESP